MKRSCRFNYFPGIFAAFLLAAAAAQTGIAQTPESTPQPNIDRNVIERKNARDRRFEAQAQGGNPRRRIAPIYFETIRDFYRKPNKEERETLKPADDVSAKYQQFLSAKNTGLTRLFNDAGCSDHSAVVVASEECLRLSMPGGGASFSFRSDTYRIWRLADITYSGGRFHSLGVLLQGIIVNIGDVPLENVSMTTRGVEFLAKFEPPTEFFDAKKTDLTFIDGIESGGFTYSRTAAAASRSTFVLRSIAYRGKIFRSYEGINYNELEFDKRKDVTVAFRVVDADDESVTILWKEIDRRDSPKIDVPKVGLK